MADVEDEHAAAEKGSQQIHPDKPARDGDGEHEPNENTPGRPQHEPHDPDEQLSRKWRRGESNP